MSRPARARIDLDALRHNYQLARSTHGGRALAVLKADAYGHGALACASALAPLADGLAVAFSDEALELRAGGIRAPILVLEGVFAPAELSLAHEQHLSLVLHHEEQLRMLEASPLPGRSMDVWLKVDSGMRRAGFPLASIASAHARVKACSAVRNTVLMTHFACADEAGSDATARQIEDFDRATSHLQGERSLANSAAILAWPQARRDWARPGILLYGADPLAARHHGLRPVMTLESEIFAMRELQAGEGLGYGHAFVAERTMRIGLVAMGYADGYPRAAPSGTPVAIDGRPSRLIGRISMDMLTVDITDLPEARIGSRVELWGANVDINAVASAAGTIAYELLCNVKRVKKSYLA